MNMRKVESNKIPKRTVINKELKNKKAIFAVECKTGESKLSPHIKYFKEIRNFYFDQVLYNKDIRICHKWDEGDFLVVDLFKMAHAVTGGFNPKEREFIGLWARETSDYAAAEGFDINEL